MHRSKFIRRLTGITLSIILLIILVNLTPSVHAADENAALINPSQIVTFEDIYVEKVLRNMLKKPEGNLTALDLSKITSFLEIGHITSLKGLEYAINLEDILVQGSKLSDLSPLAHLKKLKSLMIISDQVEDLTPLASMTSLEFVILDGNYISDLTPLKNLPNVNYLNLSNNNISDLSPLHSLKKLEILFVNDNFIETLVGAWNVPKLVTLGLNANFVRDLSFVEAIPSLLNIQFAYNQVTDISPLQSLKLTSIQLDHTDVSDITMLQSMASLNAIVTYKNPLSAESMAYLEKFKKLPNKRVYAQRGSGAVAVTKVFVDGKVQLFHTHPFLYLDSTMLPLRELFKLVGADVQWDGATRKVTATLGETKIELTINSKIALVNGQAVNLVAEPIIQNDHTMIPFRFVAEAFGFKVQWDEKNRWVLINTVN
jgi:Leucine-rich repeat (LRR) protein